MGRTWVWWSGLLFTRHALTKKPKPLRSSQNRPSYRNKQESVRSCANCGGPYLDDLAQGPALKSLLLRSVLRGRVGRRGNLPGRPPCGLLYSEPKVRPCPQCLNIRERENGRVLGGTHTITSVLSLRTMDNTYVPFMLKHISLC